MEIFVLAAILGAAFCFLIWLLARQNRPISCGTDGIWAECELRQDKRSFRYDRILALEVHAASKTARDRYRVQHI